MDLTGRSPTRTSFAASAGTPYAAEAAAEVYRAGGNAADAAVAAAAAVSVTEPLMSSIGGGGFALVRTPEGESPDGREPGGAELIDYYDRMPGKGLPASAFGAGGSPTTVILKYGAGVRSIVGAASCAVPGSLRGWEKLLERHGRLTLRETLAPAIRLAREGFALCKTGGMWMEVASEVLKLTDETIKNFYVNGERVYRIGEDVRFPELADTLEAVGQAGADLFYRGELAERIYGYILKMGGVLTAEDLATYEAIVREPLSFGYEDRAAHTNGPPSAGGATLAQILRVVSAYDLADASDAEYARVFAGAMKYALEDRDTAYTERSENARVAARLTSEEYARGQRERIFGSPGASAFGSPHTTHLSCVDASGLAVSITASMGYGSGIVIPGTGIPMNNTLGEPELNPRGFHALEPGESLISSMSPTIVSSAGGDVISLGSPGASRIPTAIAQALVHVVDFGMSLEEAVYAPRIHAEGDLFAYEEGAKRGDLSHYGRVLHYDEPNMYFGAVNAVRRTPQGDFEAAADPRRSGGVAFA